MTNFDHIWSGSIAVQSKTHSSSIQMGYGTWIALQLESHTLGLNLNVTKVSSSLGSLYRSNFIFGCKRVSGPTKQPQEIELQGAP